MAKTTKIINPHNGDYKITTKINLLILFTILFFTACSPKYEIKSVYNSKDADLKCLNSCEYNEKICEDNCRVNYDNCLVKAKYRAKDMMKSIDREYRIKLKKYNRVKDSYDSRYNIWKKEYENTQFDYDYYNNECKMGKKNSYECKKKEYLKAKIKKYEQKRPIAPRTIKKININELIAKEQSKCSLNCRCIDSYDRCFSKCGGEVKYQKICISNCND